VGGYVYYWSFFDQMPRVTIVNIEPPENPDRRIDWVVADARRLPFRDGAFDVAFSNSVIEHISEPGDREAFAAEIVRVGRRYYVQTPARWFPVEPHLMTPFIHYLPRGVQRKLLRNFTVWGVLVRPTPEGCDAFLRDIRLMTARELRLLFPSAEIWRERALGLVKSLIAVSRSSG
jgi:SAM-dependent methyltransferase